MSRLSDDIKNSGIIRKNEMKPEIFDRLCRTGFVRDCTLHYSASNTLEVLGMDGDKAFVKKDAFYHKPGQNLLHFIFINTALYNLGVGPKVLFEKDKKGELVSISRDLAYSKNQGSNRRFFADNNMQDGHIAGEAKVVGAITRFFHLDDVVAYPYERQNYGIVRKSSKPEGKVKVFDFTKANRNYNIYLEDMQILRGLAKECKLDVDGRFLSKPQRNAISQRASLERMVEASFHEAVQTYETLYGFDESRNRLTAFKEMLCGAMRAYPEATHFQMSPQMAR